MIIGSSKNATGNLTGLICLSIGVLMAPKIFFTTAENLTIQLQTHQHGCEKAEFFAGERSSPTQPVTYITGTTVNYALLNSDPQTLMATGVLKKPFGVLRIDPCTRSGETLLIKNISLSSGNKTLTYNPKDLSFECTNCTAELTTANELQVKALTGDPQLLVKNLDESLFNQANPFLQKYAQFKKVALIFLIISFFLLIIRIIFEQKQTFILPFLFSNGVALLVFKWLYGKRFLIGMNLPFGAELSQTGTAYIHLNMYSRYTDYVIYGGPFLISLIFLSGWWLWKLWQRKQA